MRSSTWRLEDLRNVILSLGFVGENLHTRQIFDCKKMFDQYPNASVSMTVTPPEGEPYPGTIERDGDMVIWDVRDSDLVAEGDGEIQLVFTQEPHIARSYNARTHICRSQVPTGSIPSGLDDYITRADQLLDEVKDTFPAGGTTGQVLAKKSDTDYDTEWVDQGGGTEDYDELENRPQIGGVTLTGNKTLHDLGAASEGDVDAKYTKPAGGIPASDIADGVIPDPEDLIDDTAGEGDTNKVWSADKSHELLTEINSKQDAPSTAGTAGQVLGLDNSLNPVWKNVDATSYIVSSDNIFDGVLVEGEQVATSTGNFVPGSSFSRTGHIPVKAGKVYLGVNSSTAAVGVHYAIYNGSKTMVSTGNIDSSGATSVGSGDAVLRYIELNVANDGFIAFDIYTSTNAIGRFVSQKLPTGYDVYVKPHIENDLILTDKTLAIEGTPADSKAVGDSLAIVNEQFSEMVYEKTEEDVSLITGITWTTGKYYDNSGVERSDAYFQHSDLIDVTPGDTISRRKDNALIKFVTTYKNGILVLKGYAGNGILEFTVPDGVDQIIISFNYSSSSGTVGDTIYRIVRTTESVNRFVEEINTIRGGYLTNAHADTLSEGDGLYCIRSSVLRNKKIVFKGDVSDSNWSVLVAHGVVDDTFDSNQYSVGFIVTPTTATPWSGGNDGSGGTTGDSWTHGLTIGSRLCVEIDVHADQTYTLRLMSESGLVEKEYNTIFSGQKGSVYAKVLSGELENAELTFACSDLQAPIWWFGDSYVYMAENRYPYWLLENDMCNCLINAYPGEGSTNALRDLKSLLRTGKPRFIVWAVGMNDHDTSNAVNQQWLDAVDEISELCEEAKITLVLATIPNVPHTSYSNVYKNAWIYDSDFRYIDFNKAIGAADEVGASWPSGWIQDDNIHPSPMGARVLAMQAMVDMPELGQ